MKKILLLLLFPALAFGQISKKQVFFTLASIGSSAPAPDPTPATIVHTTVDIAASTPANVFIYEPEGIETPPTNGWPVLLFYGGDGTDNNATTTVTGAAMSSGDTFTWTLTGANTGSNRILSTSVVIYDDAVEIARGQIGGTITGTNISSGSVGLTGSSSTITITSSEALSGSITVDYIYSVMLQEGPPLTMNQGEDFDNRGIVVCVQSRLNDNDLTAGYLTEIVEYLWLNYTINPNRINATGLSRGARQIGYATTAISINTYHTFWINETTGVVSTSDPGAGNVSSGYASLSLATMFIGGTYTNLTSFSKIGIAGVMGTSDAFGNPMPSMAATWAGNTTAWEYPYMLNLWGVTHSATAWHTNHYYRKYGTVGGGTAPWDYVDFAWKYSKDDEECATLFVEQAEKRREGNEQDIFDYREAVRKVEQLSAGAVKTALEARLVTLKATLDSEIVWRTIINHTTAAITASGNINNQTTHVDNARVDDLVDDNGNTLTGIDWFIGNNPLTSAYENEFGSSRGYNFTSGFPVNVNRAGMRISSTVCPVGFAGLPTGTYTLRLFHNESAGSFTQIELTATIGGVAKTGYSQYNRMTGYLEWTGLDETDLANFNIGRNTGDTYVTAVELIRVN